MEAGQSDEQMSGWGDGWRKHHFRSMRNGSGHLQDLGADVVTVVGIFIAKPTLIDFNRNTAT